MKIMYTNIQSVTSKLDLFITRIDSINPQIIIISETWLKPTIPDTLVKIPGYELFRDDRIGKRSGGVAIYAKANSSFFNVKLNAKYNIKHDASECLWMDIQIGNQKFLLCGLYRGLNSTLDQDIALLDLISLASESNSVIIMGDFNYGGVKWPLQNSGYLTPIELNFVQWYRASNLEQLVDNHTRFRQGNLPSTLDLILTNDESLVAEIQHEAPIGKSDHACLLTTLQIEMPEQKSKTMKWNYKQADFNKMNEQLQESLNDKIDGYSCAQGQFDVFLAEVKDAIAKHVPQTRLNHHHRNKPWISKDIKALLRQKQACWKRYVLTGLDKNYKDYRKINNTITNLSRTSRINYEKDLLNSGPKKFYSYIKQQVTSRVSIPTVLRNKEGQTLSHPHDIANAFAEQFASVFQNEPLAQLPILDPRLRIEDTIPDIVFTKEQVRQAIKEMKESSSPGPDEVPVVVLQKCDLCDSLATIMQTSFDSGILPEYWTTATVIPIFKKGNKLEPSNYRPISLTCVGCKAMEKIIVRHIRNFISELPVISDRQHGFCPRRSTVSNLLSCLSSWTKSFNEKEPIDVIYLDYEKAFDKVPITRLLLKLDFIGIRGKLLKWIEAFLRHRTYQVRVGEALSDRKNVLSGVPQGSVLGPVLYILYTFDLPHSLQCNVRTFADDTKVFANPLIDYDRLQSDLNKIAAWSKEWLINLNASKCSVLHIGKRNPCRVYDLAGVKLVPVKSQIDLGVVITEDLKWEEHIFMITKKAKSLIYLIRKAFGILTPEMVVKIFKTYIRPLLEYAFQIWSPYFIKDIVLLEKVQRSFTKLPKDLKSKPYEDRLKVLRLTSMK